jgi:hypothetical protein
LFFNKRLHSRGGIEMIVKMNGQYLMTVGLPSMESEEVRVSRSINPKLKKIAIALWTLSGSLMSKTALAAGGTSFYEQMQPLNWVFQDIALGLGSLALLVGFILLVVKKRWGTLTLKTTAVVVGGVFLAPSILILLAIVGGSLNDALWNALQGMREAKAVGGH